MSGGSLTLLIALTVALAMAALGYAFLGRRIESHDRAAKRVSNVARPGGRQSRKGKADDPIAQRRRAVQENLKELEQKQKQLKVKISLRAKLEGAGLKMTPRQFYIFSAALGAGLALVVLLVGHSPLIALGAAFAGALGLPRWILGFLIARRQKAFTSEFANALDVIVRGVKSGLPVNECLKIVAAESPEPVRSEFTEVVDSQKVGVPLDQALVRLYERMPVAEINFFMIVLTIQQKTGGNLSEALGNLSRVLRDRKKMKGKIQAMSSEAKASAMIIGSLPLIVGGIMYLTSPEYIAMLFEERIGNLMLMGCALWMGTGVLVMRKMINFNF